MTDIEFDVLDELYFVISYGDLKDNLSMKESELKESLVTLLQKDWIKVLSNVDDEIDKAEVDLSGQAESYYYLITKKGLLAHNTQ
ncbi:MAG: transporter [Cyclobacteriaceae bacterium]